MPQLNPGPWFFMYTISWLTLIFMIFLVARYMDPNKPNLMMQGTELHSWSWPW